jgi:GNAT superfamily N-acetyltransferase
MHKFVIKKVTLDNFNEFLFLINKLAEYEKLNSPDKQAIQRLKKDCQKKYFAYIGYLNNYPIAYTIFFYNYSSFLAKPILYIEDIFILKEFRKQGFGRKIFEFILKQAKKSKVGRVEWCVLNWNKPALRFYDKMNAQKLPWTFYRIYLTN